MTRRETSEGEERRARPRLGRAAARTASRFVRRRGRFAAGIMIVASFYAAAALADFIAPYDYRAQSRGESAAAATTIRFRDAAGNFHARPFVYQRRLTDLLTRAYAEDTSRAYPLTLFARGHSYKLFGLFPADRHLFGVADGADSGRQLSHQTSTGALATGATTASPSSASSSSASSSSSSSSSSPPRVSLLGADNLGRDRFSRLLAASRFSLLVGPVGTLLAGALGVLVGCLAGYSGRRTAAALMRAADAMMALPALVLILAARAALPVDLPPARAAVFLVAVFVAVGWAEMARLVRGLVLELREREFVTAAVAIGTTGRRILFRHILPNAARPVVVQLSLMLPTFLLAETALSYLGVGVQEPEASWGKMLTDAGDAAALRDHPFELLSPAVAIFLFVLGVRLLSDGLRRGRDE